MTPPDIDDTDEREAAEARAARDLPPLDAETARFLSRFSFGGWRDGDGDGADASAARSFRIRQYVARGVSYPVALRAAIWWTLPPTTRAAIVARERRERAA